MSACDRDGCALSAEVLVTFDDGEDVEEMPVCRFDAYTILTFGISEALDLRNYTPRRPAPQVRRSDSGDSR